MKKAVFVIGVLFAISVSGALFSAAQARRPHKRLVVSVEAPPAVLAIADGTGKLTGFDFSKELRSDGFPVQTAGAVLNQIEGSHADFQNVENDLPGESGGRASTGWLVEIERVDRSGGATFEIRLKGLIDGVAEVVSEVIDKKPGQKTRVQRLKTFMAVRTDKVTLGKIVLTKQGDLVVTRKSSDVDLVDDVQLLCEGGTIKDPKVCLGLKGLAEDAMSAYRKGDCKKARKHLRVLKTLLGKLHKPNTSIDWKEFRAAPEHRELEDRCKPFFGLKKKHDFVPSPGFEVLIADIESLDANCGQERR